MFDERWVTCVSTAGWMGGVWITYWKLAIQKDNSKSNSGTQKNNKSKWALEGGKNKRKNEITEGTYQGEHTRR